MARSMRQEFGHIWHDWGTQIIILLAAIYFIFFQSKIAAVLVLTAIAAVISYYRDIKEITLDFTPVFFFSIIITRFFGVLAAAFFILLAAVVPSIIARTFDATRIPRWILVLAVDVVSLAVLSVPLWFAGIIMSVIYLVAGLLLHHFLSEEPDQHIFEFLLEAGINAFYFLTIGRFISTILGL